MPQATYIALGAAALGLVVFAFCLMVAFKAKKKHSDPTNKP